MAEKYEVTFGTDKYGDPELLDYKTSIAQQIVNALFLVPGNLPSLPKAGVNIKKYMYMSQEELEASAPIIKSDLKYTCGAVMSDVVIGGIDFSVQTSSKGEAVFLLIVTVTFPKEETSVLGISIVDSKDRVRFNFDYADFL